MDKEQQATLRSLIRSQRYLEIHARDFERVLAAPAKEDLDEMIGQLKEFRDLQASAGEQSKHEAKQLHRAVAELRDAHMRAIAEIGVSHLTHVPEIAGLSCPRACARPVDIITAALTMHESIREHKVTFVMNGLDPAFDEKLAAAINEVGQRMLACSRFKTKAIGATRVIVRALEQGLKARRTLDVLVAPLAPIGTRLRAGWDATMRVQRERRAT